MIILVTPVFSLCIHSGELAHCLFDHRIGEVGLGGLGLVEAGLEGVTEGHQFIDFGDDAVLFF